MSENEQMKSAAKEGDLLGADTQSSGTPAKAAAAPGSAPGMSGASDGQTSSSEYRSLAERIYDLDTEVYRLVGSDMGRTIIGSREKAVGILQRELETNPASEVVMSDMALIRRMARTIRDQADRKRMLRKYDELFQAITSVTVRQPSFGIADESRIQLNPFAAGAKRFTADDRLIICIGRAYGSAGDTIGYRLADDIHINYYDAAILEDMTDRLQAAKEKPENEDLEFALDRMHRSHGLKRLFENLNRFHGLPEEDAAFFNQSSLIEERARAEDFVIMGRNADVILRNAGIPHVSIFITAPFDIRARRIMQLHNLSMRDAVRLVKRVDRRHAHFYHRYTGYRWGQAEHYDLCVNSASYGIEESEELIIRVIKARVRDDLAEAAAERNRKISEAAQKNG